MPLNAAMPWWATLAMALIFGSGGIGFLAYIARPSKEITDDLRTEIEKLRANDAAQDAKIERFQRDNALKSNSITALTMHGDTLRDLILNLKPDAKIETCYEVLMRVRRSFEDENKDAKPLPDAP